ncbi:hypothetical protein [Mumia sp. Pv 4-285]|uniref:hypothetical protein n=1 Tax=Mumia qirimensis TaxID=3234852 RepID=UPI00351D4D55
MVTSQDGEATPPKSAPERTVPSHAADASTRAKEMLRKAVIVLAIAVIIVAIGYALAAFVPRWWAQWIGARVDGRLTAGTVWGLFLGIVFTFLPLLLVWQAIARRWIRGWWIAVAIGVAILLALPNLMTLSIVLGTSNGAHAGERILDVDVPGFRAATLWGAIIAVVLLAGLIWLTTTNRQRGRRVRDLSAEVSRRDEVVEPGHEPEKPGDRPA